MATTLPPTPTLKARVQGALQRMIGFNAGLPQQQLTPPVTDMTARPGMNQQGVIPLRGEAPQVYQATGATVRVRGFERHPVVSACIRAIVDVASAVPIQSYKKKPAAGNTEDIVILPSTFDANRLLASPSPFFSAQRLRAMTFTHYLVYGNALWHLDRADATPQGNRPGSTALPVAIRIIHPEDVMCVYVNVFGYPVWYLWRDVLGYMHTSPVTDIVHFRDLNAKGLVFGYPRAASALSDIIGDDEASQYVREVVTNSGMPPSYAIVNEDTTPQEAKVAEDALFEKLVARGQRGRMIFMGGVKDVKTTGFNLRDLEFPDLRRVAREDICAAFGVDPRMVGITSASRDAGLSGTQYTEARTRLIQQTIEPMMRAFASELDLWLAPEFGDIFLRFDPDSLQALVEDDELTSARVCREVAAALMSIEEGREALGRPSEFAPGDTLAITSTTMVVPAEQALLGPPPPTPSYTPDGKLIDPANPPKTHGPPLAAPKPPAGKPAAGKPAATTKKSEIVVATITPITPAPVTPAIPSVTVPASAPYLSRGIVLSNDQRAMLWQSFDARAVAEEAPYRRTALMQFGEERSMMAKLFGQQVEHSTGDATKDAALARVVKKAVVSLYKPNGDIAERWIGKFSPLVRATYVKGADHVTASIRSVRDATAELTPPEIEAAVRTRVARLALNVGATTADAITTAIEIGIREAMSIDEIASLVDQTAFGTSAGSRATMIARTETIGALNQGQFDAAMGTNVVAGKEWLTQGDDRVRDSHADCEDEGMIPITGKFLNGCQFPGDPSGGADEVINCRCTTLFYDTYEPPKRSDARYNPNHDPATGQFSSGGGGGASTSTAPKKATQADVGKSPADMGWETTHNGVDISGERVLTKYDTPAVLEARKAYRELGQTVDLPNRDALRAQAVDAAYGTGATNKNRVADVVLGGPGAGKSSTVAEPVAAQHGSLVIDADAVKSHLPEYANGKGAGRVQVESAILTEGPLLARAVSNGDNIVMPLVGRDAGKIANITNHLAAQGYTVNLHYVDVEPETQVERTMNRFKSTGRFVDPVYVESVDHKPLATYNALKDSPTFAHVTRYDNNGATLVTHHVRATSSGLEAVDPKPAVTAMINRLKRFVPVMPAAPAPIPEMENDDLALDTLRRLPLPKMPKPNEPRAEDIPAPVVPAPQQPNIEVHVHLPPAAIPKRGTVTAKRNANGEIELSETPLPDTEA